MGHVGRHSCRSGDRSAGHQGDSGTESAATKLSGGTLGIGRADGADATQAKPCPALIVGGTGNTGARTAAACRALIVLRAGQAGTIAAGLPPCAVSISRTGKTRTVLAEPRGALIVCGAGRADAQETEIGRTLVVPGAGGTEALCAHVAAQTLRTVGTADHGEHAVGSAGIAGLPVEQTVVALFQSSDDAVAADIPSGHLDTVLPLATGRAAVSFLLVAVARPTVGRIGRVTLLLWGFDDAIAAVLQVLPLTVQGAIVPVHVIAVVTFLAGIEKAVTAAGSQALLPLAEGGTTVSIHEIAIVALFVLLGDAVAAEGIPLDLLDITKCVTAVAIG